jgi:hypothetical protein
MAFAENNQWTGLDMEDQQYYLGKARKEEWSLSYMARMIAFDHDLKNGKKCQNICIIHQTDERRQEMVMGKVKARTHNDHAQKGFVCNDYTTSEERSANRIVRAMTNKEELDTFLTPVDQDKLRDQPWFWLDHGNNGTHDPKDYFVQYGGADRIDPSCCSKDGFCSTIGCDKNIYSGGVCRDHVTQRCSTIGCEKNMHSGGVCKDHGPRCSAIGCEKNIHLGGVCKDHGPRCSTIGCEKNIYSGGVCWEHGFCSTIGCDKNIYSGGVCRDHGPRCSTIGCDKNIRSGGVCKGHGPRCSTIGCEKNIHSGGVCKDHGPRCSTIGCEKNIHSGGVCKGHALQPTSLS